MWQEEDNKLKKTFSNDLDRFLPALVCRPTQCERLLYCASHFLCRPFGTNCIPSKEEFRSNAMLSHCHLVLIIETGSLQTICHAIILSKAAYYMVQ